jgi:hypothetical protein
MPVSRRFTPEHAPGETCSFGLDFSFVIPVGQTIVQGAFAIWTNTADPVPADADWTIGPVEVRGRAVYVSLSGGTNGVDYQLKFTAVDSAGNVWPRTCLVLCADTS